MPKVGRPTGRYVWSDTPDGVVLDSTSSRPCAWAVLGEEPQPVAHDDRVDPQVDLVDEVVLEQPAEELAAAMDLELAPGRRLQLADRRLEAARDDLGVLPGPGP